MLVALLALSLGSLFYHSAMVPDEPSAPQGVANQTGELASVELEKLPIKPPDPSQGYKREQFGHGWRKWRACDTRQQILARDLTELSLGENGCTVLSGILQDPYTGQTINFVRGPATSGAVQIDHVVALSNAWRTGAQQLSSEVRTELANDPLELLAVDGPANQQKGAGDASQWLPKYKAFHCQYIARQIAVKLRYYLWVTQSEYEAMRKVLTTCPEQRMPRESVVQ